MEGRLSCNNRYRTWQPSPKNQNWCCPYPRIQTWPERPEPQINEYDCIRQDRQGSSTVHHRGGGLVTYIQTGIQYSTSMLSTLFLEIQQITLHKARRRQLWSTNVYLLLPLSDYAHAANTNWTRHLPVVKGVICSDLNAHNPSWDNFARPDARGTLIKEWLEEVSKTTLNDGSPTQDAGSAHGPGINTPDLTIVDDEIVY